jgi:hypothetical protein
MRDFQVATVVPPPVIATNKHIVQHVTNHMGFNSQTPGNPLGIGWDWFFGVVVHIKQPTECQIFLIGKMGRRCPIVTYVKLVIVHFSLTLSHSKKEIAAGGWARFSVG